MSDQRNPENSQNITENPRYDHLIEHIQDAIVEFEMIDGRPIVRTVNQAFEEVFGYEESAVLGESLNEWIVPEWLLEEARSFDQQTSSSEVTYRRVRRETSSGLRDFLYRGIPFDNRRLDGDGVAIYTDITDISRTERRLEVMNRVLRHNLRNSTNVIAGHTSRLLADFEESASKTTGAAAAIETAAADLENLTEEARDIHTVLKAQRTDDASIDLVSVVHRVLSTHRRRSPAARIDTSLPESVHVSADQHFHFAVDSLVDNAIEHNPTEDPRVLVGVESGTANGWVDLVVDDDAPRIPADERAVITGEAEITPMRHGSGLGLWLAKWTTEHFGGELSFETSDMGGNRVRIRLPRSRKS